MRARPRGCHEARGIGPDHPLRQPRRALRRQPRCPRARDPGNHRAGQRRQDLVSQGAEPDGSLRLGDAVRGHHPFRRRRHPPVAQRLRAAQENRRRLSPARGPAAHRVRQRRPRPAPRRREEPGGARRDRRALPHPRGAVGRGEGPAPIAGEPALGWSAAAADDCPRALPGPPRSSCSTSSRSRSIR